jgi:hypothetical protein
LGLAKRALADVQMKLALEQAYLAEACQQMGQTVGEFKKKPAGRRRAVRSKLSRS